MVLLVTVVMPAEYGVDPTWLGRVLGLTRMGEIKVALARKAAAAEAAEAALADGVVKTAASDASEAHPPAGEPNEAFPWSVARGVMHYDTHGDPHDAPAGVYHGYRNGTATAGVEGVLVAAFDGLHGWFWRNRGSSPVTVTLWTEGDYQELREIK